MERYSVEDGDGNVGERGQSAHHDRSSLFILFYVAQHGHWETFNYIL